MKLFSLIFFIPFILLYGQTDDSWKLYSDTSLARIDITINAATLQWVYNNVNSDSEHVASVRFRNRWIDEVVDSIGFGLRGNTSRASKKKSFKVSFNTFIKGRKFHGVEKLNLNGEHNDPSIIRSKLAFDLFRDMGITASRANHARVYINGTYYGLYISVEHVDEEFLKKNYADDSGNLWKCLYPADLKYLGSNPNLYKNVMHNASERAYELTTNETADDYSQFSRLVNIINNTTAGVFADSLEAIMDVRSLLQYFAVNTLVGSWDDYRSLMNNYYLYLDPAGGTFTLIPYDYDNSFGVDWFSVQWATANPYTFPKAVSGARPMWDKIIAVGQYRDLYTHFLRFYRDKVYALPFWEERLQRIKDTISLAAIEDSFRTLDYGFTVADFHNSYSSTPFSKQHVKTGIREFVNQRNASINSQLNYTNATPIVYRIDVRPTRPLPTDSITISAACFGAGGLKNVWILFTPEGSSTAHTIVMSPAPVANTQRVEESDRWIGVIPPLNGKKSGAFRIFIQDSLNHAQMYPRVDSIRIVAASTASSLIINEFMADNTSITDPAGQFDDWVELFNPTAQPIVLTGKYITDKASALTKSKFTQPNLVMAPGEYLIVWCDEDTLQQGVHAGIKLSAGGEFIAVTDSDGVTVLDSLSFGPQRTNISFGRYPNGSSTWGTMNPTPLAANSPITRVDREERMPLHFAVDVFPNPFNPSTTIRFVLSPIASDAAGKTVLEIFNVLGEKVTTLVNEVREPGTYSVQWNAAPFASGVYFAKLHYGGNAILTKMLLLK